MELLLSQLVNRLFKRVLKVCSFFKCTGIFLVCLRKIGCLLVNLILKLGQLTLVFAVKVLIEVYFLNHLVSLDLSHVEFCFNLSGDSQKLAMLSNLSP